MTQVLTKKKTRRKNTSHKNDGWIQCIPGYDPVATAEDCWFDRDAARLAIGFFPDILKHSKGSLAGKPFKLERWEKAIIANAFGWKRPDGTRRYREVFIYVPRKNGKTCLAAGIILLMMFTDGEPGAEIYSAAADRDQAMLVFKQAEGMVIQEPELENRCRIYPSSKSIVKGSSSYKAISAVSNTKHGYNSHLVVVDELHAQPNRDLVDVLITSTASRIQPMVVHITTADFNRESICNEKLDYAEKVRDGIVQDKSFLPVIYAASQTDDWQDPKVWKRANPNFGISVSPDYFKMQCRRAIETPSFENTFKRLHLNIMTEQDVRWLQIERWDCCDAPIDLEELRHQPAWGGLDLSSTTDLTSFVLAFRPIDNDGIYRLLLWCWVPGESMERRYLKDKVPYPTWVRQGFIEKTDGNVVDYSRVRAKINDVAKIYSVQEIAYDPWNATHIANELGDEDGFNMVEFRQGFHSMNEPTKALERLMLDKKLAHGGNPVLRWAASNVTVKIDEAGNLKPDKKKSTERIDPIVASIMAMSRAMTNDAAGKSAYDDYDLDTENDAISW